MSYRQHLKRIFVGRVAESVQGVTVIQLLLEAVLVMYVDSHPITWLAVR